MKVKGVQNSQSMGDTKEKPCFISQYPIRKGFLFFVRGKEELSGKNCKCPDEKSGLDVFWQTTSSPTKPWSPALAWAQWQPQAESSSHLIIITDMHGGEKQILIGEPWKSNEKNFTAGWQMTFGDWWSFLFPASENIFSMVRWKAVKSYLGLLK